MRILPIILIAGLLSTSCARPGSDSGREGTPSPRSQSSYGQVGAPENQLIVALRAAFQRENPKLAQVGILDVAAWDFTGPRVLLGWSIVSDKVFRGDFRDEMFGVFVVNDSLTRVERVVATIPTPRWFDFEMKFGRLTTDSIEVRGTGATYGDGPMTWVYKWR